VTATLDVAIKAKASQLMPAIELRRLCNKLDSGVGSQGSVSQPVIRELQVREPHTRRLALSLYVFAALKKKNSVA
jgi:hypothetical protein